MQKIKFPAWTKVLLFLGVILCSLLSGIYIIPAIAFYAVLCVVMPGPLLIIPPLLSSLAAFIFGIAFQSLPAAILPAANSIFYLLPAVLIAMSYFKTQSKMQTIVNGTAGLFIFFSLFVVLSFITEFGKFTPEFFNSVIDGYITSAVSTAEKSMSEFQAVAEEPFDLVYFEELMLRIKPLIPALVTSVFFIMCYISVSITNGILKKFSVIENVGYRMVPHWICGVLFFISFFGNWFVSSDSFASVLLTSANIILMPSMFIFGLGMIKDLLIKIFRTKFIAVVLIIVAFIFGGTIIYNLFYLTGCYYSIIVGIRNRQHNNFEGDN